MYVVCGGDGDGKAHKTVTQINAINFSFSSIGIFGISELTGWGWWWYSNYVPVELSICGGHGLCTVDIMMIQSSLCFEVGIFCSFRRVSPYYLCTY